MGCRRAKVSLPTLMSLPDIFSPPFIKCSTPVQAALEAAPAVAPAPTAAAVPKGAASPPKMLKRSKNREKYERKKNLQFWHLENRNSLAYLSRQTGYSFVLTSYSWSLVLCLRLYKNRSRPNERQSK